MSELPPPLLPAEINLRDFPYMPLEVKRLLGSETWIEAADHPKIGHALICLWAASWHEVPAASLPTNDKVLARMAMCSAQTWRKLKKVLLEGWIECSDHRYYHPVVVEKALDAWSKKNKQKQQTDSARRARNRNRNSSVTESVTEPSQTSNKRQENRSEDNRKEVTKEKPALALFRLTPELTQWYQEQGYQENIIKHLDHFIDYCKSSGKNYKDLASAFRNAVRQDWAGLRKGMPNRQTKLESHNKGVVDQFLKEDSYGAER